MEVDPDEPGQSPQHNRRSRDDSPDAHGDFSLIGKQGLDGKETSEYEQEGEAGEKDSPASLFLVAHVVGHLGYGGVAVHRHLRDPVAHQDAGQNAKSQQCHASSDRNQKRKQIQLSLLGCSK